MANAAMKIVLLVAVWWIANAVTSIASKQEVSNYRYNDNGITLLVFTELKWLELTLVQFLAGAIVSAIVVTYVKREKLPLIVGREDFPVIISNLFGHMAVNLSYCFISSGTTQVIKSSEPLFMFFLLTVFGDKGNQNKLSLKIFTSLILMSFGTCLFLIWDATFNFWGVFAALVSNTAFPIRNISLKLQSHTYKNSFEKYFVLSFYGSLVMAPVLLGRMLVQQRATSLISRSGIAAGNFHCIYNIASISVLERVSPMTHAILNFSKRILVIVANIEYFNVAITWQMGLGLIMVVVGLVLYYKKAGLGSTASPWQITKRRYFPRRAVMLVGLAFFAGMFIGLQINVPDITSSHNAMVRHDVEEHDRVTTSWVYHRSMPEEVVENIQTLHRFNKETNIHVYCGSTQCTRQVQSLRNPMITASFIVIPDLLHNTSLNGWFMRHPLHKILAGVHFEDHLQEAVKLAHLWHYGGIFVSPTVQIKQNLSPTDLVEWIAINDSSPLPATLDACSFKPAHPFISRLMNALTEEYANYNNTKVAFSFSELARHAYTTYCGQGERCPRERTVSMKVMRNGPKVGSDVHFGVLQYEGITKNISTKGQGVPWRNLGDEIQAFPGAQFLPYVDFFYDRDYPVAVKTQGSHTIFFNAFWGVKMNWPPSPKLSDPILLSVHFEYRFKKALASRGVMHDFVRAGSPIGCRDMGTLRAVRKEGLEAFFSGCITQMLQNPNKDGARTGKIYAVDVRKTYRKLLPARIADDLEVVSHNTKNITNLFRQAYERVAMYSSARLVITERLHSAIPTIGLGVPVIFINDGKILPGGRPDRLEGLTDLLHFVDGRTMTMDDIKAWFERFNWTNPPQNPNLGKRMGLVTSFWNVIRKRPVLYEAAHKFGLFPLTHPSLVGPTRIVFHVIFDAIKLGATFSRYHWRCLESILRHHPDAKLFIHSNYLEQSSFNVFTEVGYDVNVNNYSLLHIAKDTQFAKTIMSQTDEISNSVSSHFDLFRVLMLYKYGGISIPVNSIVVKPLYNIAANMLLGRTQKKLTAETVKFEKGHEFLHKILERFFIMSKEAKQGFEFSKTWSLWSDEAKNYGVQTLPRNSFSSAADLERKCAGAKPSHKKLESQIKQIENAKVPVVQVPLANIVKHVKKFKEGTICHHLLNSYCVLCDNIY